MSQFLLFNQISVIFVGLFSIFIAIVVYSGDKKSKTNRYFALLAIFISLWIILTFFASTTSDLSLGAFLSRLAYGSVAILFIPFYFFSVHFLKEEEKYPSLNLLVPISCLFLFFFSITTSLMVTEMTFTKFGPVPILGKGKNVYFAIIFLLLSFIINRFLKNYFGLSKKEKLKVQYFLIGFFIWVSANLIFNIVLPVFQRTPQFWALGNYSAIFLLSFTAYAIVKRELFGIKVVLTSLLIGAIGIVLALQILIAPNTLWRIIDTIIFLLFCLFGYYLLRAVQQEEKRREEAEMLAIREMAFRQKAEKLAAEFKRLDEAKTQFMLATQHHLRTPLTSIQGYLSMLLEGSYGKISDRAKPKIKNALVATQRLIRLANEFLDVAQFEVGKETMAKREVQIEEVFDEVVDELRQTAKEKKLYVKLERPEQSLPSIMVDREKIKEAIYNVVFNGIKYTERGGVIIKLEIANGKLQIVITDTGIGMEPEEIAGLFAKTFERGEQAKKLYTTGRGIGLYLAYQIIKAHGGRLWAESEGRGKGSTFYIELPIN